MRGLTVCALAVLWLTVAAGQEKKPMTQRDLVQQILDATRPLPHPRSERPPLYLWHLTGLGTTDPQELASLLQALDTRGLAAIASWSPKNREQSLAAALALSRAQRKLGLDVNINAVAVMYSFFDGSPETAHVTATGERFFDTSQAANKQLGCPFAVTHRLPVIRDQVEYFLDAYRREGLPVDFIFGDWEIDGPIPWNDGWATAKRCARCREKLPQLDDFAAYQELCQRVRGELQRDGFAQPVRQRFPRARVGNYAVYPNDGWRYWFDYFEQAPSTGQPFRLDQRCPVRPWPSEFGLTGYTVAMPVIYTWYRTWSWYDYPNGDYRWFYNLLLNGSNAAKSTPAATPLVTFVHWHTTSPPEQPDPAVQPMSAGAYQELLWHLLLRGHDALFLWSPRDEAVEESRLLHEVYAAALEWREFLDGGTPITFEVPTTQGPVISGLRLGDRVLARRTDFDDRRDAVTVTVDGRPLAVPRQDGRCQVLALGR